MLFYKNGSTKYEKIYFAFNLDINKILVRRSQLWCI